jgi:hypothetical protein
MCNVNSIIELRSFLKREDGKELRGEDNTVAKKRRVKWIREKHSLN